MECVDVCPAVLENINKRVYDYIGTYFLNTFGEVA